MKSIAIVTICFFSLNFANAQSIKVSGYIQDSLGLGLEMANVLALDALDSSMSGYAISNTEGRYEISLESNKNYILRFSYLGFETKDIVFSTAGKEKNNKLDIVLKEQINSLNEVEIVENIPIAVSGDTIIYQTDAFTNGEEKKLEDVLEKLPGFEVDDNGEVTVQGKSVEKVMVEGKDFFDGDTKLATQNIPASAIDKVQVLRNYNDVSPMRGLDNDDRVAINIKLKEGKKNITFGDVKAEGGLDERYLLHPSLFIYTPKASFNIIGDVNNIGEPAFTFRDYFRFTGGFKNISQKSGSSLRVATDDIGFSMIQGNRAEEITARFGAANFSYNPNKKWTISGFAIGNQTQTIASNTNFRTYLRQDTIANTEDLVTNNIQNSNSGLFKLSTTYTPSPAVHIGYDAIYKITSLEEDNNKQSTIANFTNDINTINSQNPSELNQSLEAYYDIDEKNVIAFEAQHLYKKQDPLIELLSQLPTFNSLIPLVDTNNYNLLQNKLITTNKVEASLNYYYIINNKNHINFSVGTSNSNQSFNSQISQLVDGNTLAEFDGDSLSNNVLFNLNDIFLGAHYKTKIGKLTLSPGVNFHRYSITDQQQGSSNTREKNLILPDFFAKYDFKTSESLTFNYGMVAQFTDINNIILGTTISSYNSLFLGNRDLDNSWYHNISMNYFSFNMFNFTNIFAGLSYNKRIGDITNTIVYRGLERINQPINTDAANDILSAYGSYEKRFGKFKTRVRGNVSFSTNNNTIDGIENTNTSLTQSYTASFETNFKTAPNVEVGFQRTTNDYEGSQSQNGFITNRPYIKLEARFLKSFSAEADYSYSDYFSEDRATQSAFDFLNAALYYQKTDSKWEFSLRGLNLLGTQNIRQDAFSDNLISTTSTTVLPRYVLFGVKYGL